MPPTAPVTPARPAVSELGRRERKRLQTQEALRSAALRLFRRQGFDATTVEDISEAADVSARTFFRYFASKEDVVFTEFEERLSQLATVLASRPDDEPVLTSLRESILTLSHVFEEHREDILVQAQLVASSPSLAARSVQVRDGLNDVVAAFVAERLGVDRAVDLRPGLVAGAVVGAMGVAVDTWVAAGAAGDLVQRVRAALELLDHGFGLTAD